MDVALVSKEQDLDLVGNEYHGHPVDTVIINGPVGDLQKAIDLLKTYFVHVLYIPSNQAWSVEREICAANNVVYGQRLVWKHPKTHCQFLLCSLWTPNHTVLVDDNRFLLDTLHEKKEGWFVIVTRNSCLKFTDYHYLVASTLLDCNKLSNMCQINCVFGSFCWPKKNFFHRCLHFKLAYCELDDCSGYAINSNWRCSLHQPPVSSNRYRLLSRHF